MTYPAPFTSTTFVAGEKLTAVKLFTRVLTWLNSFLSAFLGVGQGFLGELEDATPVTLSTTSATTSASLVFTLAASRRVRIISMANFNLSAAGTAQYACRSAYNTGSSTVASTATQFGFIGRCSTATASTNGECSADSDGTVVLAAGTYTAIALVFRVSGGFAADTCPSSYIAVYDVSAT